MNQAALDRDPQRCRTTHRYHQGSLQSRRALVSLVSLELASDDKEHVRLDRAAMSTQVIWACNQRLLDRSQCQLQTYADIQAWPVDDRRFSPNWRLCEHTA